MLQQFSWTQFLISSAVLSAVWYIGLLFTAYRQEASAFFSRQRTPPPVMPPKKSPIRHTEVPELESDLMGKSKLPDGLEVVTMGALNFSAPYNSQIGERPGDELGLIPDVLQELKEIFAVLAKEDGTKSDFLSLSGIIGEKYGTIGSHPKIGQINEFVRDHAPFAITDDELELMWS